MAYDRESAYEALVWGTVIIVVLLMIAVAAARDYQCRSLVLQAFHANQPFVAEWIKTSEACH